MPQRLCAFSSIASNTGARSPGERIDDLQYLCGRGLLLQCLARLGHQPRVLHRDNGLRREILQQRDLLIGERPHLLAVKREVPKQPIILAQANRQNLCAPSRQRTAIPPRSAYSSSSSTRSENDMTGLSREHNAQRSSRARRNPHG